METNGPSIMNLLIDFQEWGAEGYEVWCIQKLEELSKQETQEQPLYTDKGSREVPNVEDHLEEIKECREMPQGAAEAEDIEVGAEAMESPHSTGVQEKTCVLQFSFIKSALTVNPCMVSDDLEILTLFSYGQVITIEDTFFGQRYLSY